MADFKAKIFLLINGEDEMETEVFEVYCTKEALIRDYNQQPLPIIPQISVKWYSPLKYTMQANYNTGTFIWGSCIPWNTEYNTE